MAQSRPTERTANPSRAQHNVSCVSRHADEDWSQTRSGSRSRAEPQLRVAALTPSLYRNASHTAHYDALERRATQWRAISRVGSRRTVPPSLSPQHYDSSPARRRSLPLWPAKQSNGGPAQQTARSALPPQPVASRPAPALRSPTLGQRVVGSRRLRDPSLGCEHRRCEHALTRGARQR